MQAKDQYHKGHYRIAADFWERAVRSDNGTGGYKANLADALIRVHNYSDAIKNYKTLYNGTPENLHYRYGLGRALLYDGQYKEAIDLLRGVGTEFDDGGSAGQARILEAAAHYGAAMHTTTDFEKKMKIDMAVKSLCEGLQITTYDWRKLIEGDSDEGGFSQIRIILINIYPPSCTSQKAETKSRS